MHKVGEVPRYETSMTSSRDAFGFANGKPREASQPANIIAHPGQEIRIVVPDAAGAVPGFGDSSPSPSRSQDNSSPSSSKDNSSPSIKKDERSNPFGGTDAFGFHGFRRGFSPSPITIVAQPGQEIRVVVPDGQGRIDTLRGDQSSPSASKDNR